MGDTAAGLLTLGVLVLLLAATHAPLGAYLANVFTTDRHWRVERRAYRIVGVNPDQEQPWTVYAASVGAFSVVSFLLLFLVILAQGWLPLNHGESMHVDTALNTAVSFVTNTNWQSYAGEAGTSVFVQAVGLTVQNFASAAVGIAVVAALIRAIARHESRYIGNFWVDLTRVVVRILLPIAAVAAVVLILGGVIQNLAAPTDVTGVTGAAQSIPGGLVASQEAIKELGT
ncbi:MAG TPA: potassium-transporting ATPase subunit KdpA, partial [Lapillicoccus sp.]|nr:potassium-transporting ATPase subunit KdpA [Lapillicoccus sp.]